MNKKRNVQHIIKGVKQLVESELLAGVSEIFHMDKRENAKGDATWGELKKQVFSCKKCSLYKTKIHYVFGEGNTRAKLMFVGEAPGHEEDKQARPFVGRAGQLLTKIIEAIGLQREDVYIANVIKCRPPENRTPLPNEIFACMPYLMKQIELIKPKVICLLGKVSAQTLLKVETPITKLRGRFYNQGTLKLMPTYHPAYLLRNPEGKKDVWKDMQEIAKELGLKIPQNAKSR